MIFLRIFLCLTIWHCNSIKSNFCWNMMHSTLCIAHAEHYFFAVISIDPLKKKTNREARSLLSLWRHFDDVRPKDRRCNKLHPYSLDGVKSRGSLVIARASINIHSGCGCTAKKKAKRMRVRGRERKKKIKTKTRKGSSSDPALQQGFASISNVVIDLGAVKAWSPGRIGP